MGLRLNTGDTGNYVTSADDGSLYAGIYGKGCYVTQVGSKFAATLISNTEIRIADGDAIINGRHCMLNPNEYETIAITPGATGYNRTDLIGIQYTNDNGTESAEMTVIQGTSSQEAPEPEYDDGDILAGATSKFFPLWRVGIRGINIFAIQSMFTVVPSLSTMSKSDIGLGNVDNTPDANKNVLHAGSADEATKAVQLKTSRKLITRGACVENSVDFNGTSDVVLKVAIAREDDYETDVFSDSHGNSITAHFWRVGCMVFMTAHGRLRIDATDVISGQTNAIPQRFRPAQNVPIMVAPYSSHQIADKIVRFDYQSDGTVNMYLQSGFTGTYYFSHSGAWFANGGAWFGWQT